MARTSKGREKSTSNLQRRKPIREPNDRILIVCEGTKTEPNYFNGIKRDACIPALQILPSQRGPQPLQVVDSAKSRFFEKNRQFDKVFAVFDRDDHPDYPDAIRQAESLDGKLKNDEGKPVLFKAIASVPCFELWLLLHYRDIQYYSDRKDILDQLQTCINYTKGHNRIYELTKGNLPTATIRAEFLRKRFSRLPVVGPYTDVDELVGILTAFGSGN